jgi:hypothetical protein
VQASLRRLLEYERGDNMSPYVLPTFKGYTVDMHLREFRREIPDVVFEIIPFNSPKGKELIEELKAFALQVIDLRPDEW